MKITENKVIAVRFDEINPFVAAYNYTDRELTILKSLFATAQANYEKAPHWNPATPLPLLRVTVTRLAGDHFDLHSKSHKEHHYILRPDSPSVWRILRTVQAGLDRGEGAVRYSIDPGLYQDKPLWGIYYRQAFPVREHLGDHFLVREIAEGWLIRAILTSDWQIMIGLTDAGYDKAQKAKRRDSVKSFSINTVKFDKELALDFALLTGLAPVEWERWSFSTAQYSEDISPYDIIDGSVDMYEHEPEYRPGDLVWEDPNYAIRFWWEDLELGGYAHLQPYYMGDRVSLTDQHSITGSVT